MQKHKFFFALDTAWIYMLLHSIKYKSKYAKIFANFHVREKYIEEINKTAHCHCAHPPSHPPLIQMKMVRPIAMAHKM